jgi:hypothetical protein
MRAYSENSRGSFALRLVFLAGGAWIFLLPPPHSQDGKENRRQGATDIGGRLSLIRFIPGAKSLEAVTSHFLPRAI